MEPKDDDIKPDDIKPGTPNLECHESLEYESDDKTPPTKTDSVSKKLGGNLFISI